jgi:hypothetical protein
MTYGELYRLALSIGRLAPLCGFAGLVGLAAFPR